ncbi:MAG: hypothetical protein NVS4B6_32220 [Mycobacterium sp.]
MRFDRPGDTYPPPAPRAPLSAYACNRPPTTPWDQYKFTPREAEVAYWLARGEPNKLIAGYLNVAHQTVRRRVGRILVKTKSENRTKCALRLAGL